MLFVTSLLFAGLSLSCFQQIIPIPGQLDLFAEDLARGRPDRDKHALLSDSTGDHDEQVVYERNGDQGVGILGLEDRIRDVLDLLRIDEPLLILQKGKTAIFMDESPYLLSRETVSHQHGCCILSNEEHDHRPG